MCLPTPDITLSRFVLVLKVKIKQAFALLLFESQMAASDHWPVDQVYEPNVRTCCSRHMTCYSFIRSRFLATKPSRTISRFCPAPYCLQSRTWLAAVAHMTRGCLASYWLLSCTLLVTLPHVTSCCRALYRLQSRTLLVAVAHNTRFCRAPY